MNHGPAGREQEFDIDSMAVSGEAADTPKVQLLMSYAGQSRDVADSWYTGDFETTYRDIIAGTTALLKTIG